MNPVRSMTGYARVRSSTPDGEITLSLRGVNHRALDLHFHIPSALDPYETVMRKAIQARVVRGHIEIRASLTGSAAVSAAQINRPLLAAYLRAFEETARGLNLDQRPDLNAALRLPGMIVETQEAEPSPEMEAAIVAVVDEALRIFNAEREKEGAGLVRDLLARIERIAAHVAGIEALRETVLPALETRMRERMAELIENADPQRLYQEAALLADRSDIAEEITRLKLHCESLRSLLTGGGETGKKCEFLLQEMHRETNTMLSKSNSAGEPGRKAATLALAVKSEIEKIREQSLNLE
jgi:uncharacterized protein (TIGR00255 family)